ncbi:MAG: 50S ribosomal protein L30 [Holosporales bacterium]|nr:50S ribosomal protein L30 [Holosporales bacterium]
MKEKAKKTIKVRQVGSSIRRNGRQALYLDSLGLGKIGKEKELVDSRSVRKLIAKVRHMIVVEE